MNNKPHSAFFILNSLFLLLAVLTLCLAPRAVAQGDTVTVSAAEFQRMVYSSDLLMQLDEKPELDASLQVLLELQRRNPHADPATLAGVLRQATARYRTNAPSYLGTTGYREEILSAYLDALRQVPARTNFVPATLQLLNDFMLKPADYTTASAAELIHAGNQRLLAAEEAIARREELVDLCTQRGYENSAFGAAMDSLLWPETGALLAYTPAQILSINSALSNSPTMQTMLDRSRVSGDGSVTLSTNELKSLFALEMETMHEIINTNLAMNLEMLGAQTDVPSYLTNTTLIQANLQREAAVKQGQPQQLAAASAAVNNVSRLTASKLPAAGQAMNGLGRGVKSIADGITGLGTGWNAASKLGKAACCANFTAGGLQIVGAVLQIAGVFQDPNDVILQQIGQVKTMINDLSTNMNYRFDQVDRSLNQVLDKVSYSISLIGEVGHDVDEVRKGLVDVQTDLHRLERHLQTYISQLYDRGLNQDFNTYLGYEATYGYPMGQADYNNTEAGFFTLARNNSVDGLSSPYSDRNYTPAGLYWELMESSGGASNRLDQNLSYIKKYLADTLGQNTAGKLGELANPRDWFVGAYAYMQLAVENPMRFRQVNISNRLDLITARGRDLTNFLRSLTFAGSSTNINWPLRNALLDNYETRLDDFVSQVHTTEQQYADLHLDGLPVATWRDWAAAAPRVTTAGAVVKPLPLYAQGVTNIAAGGYHSLALTKYGTVVGWGDNTAGQTTIPPEATNIIAIAGGLYHSLALRSDGVVICWGTNNYNQCIRPDDATNVVAIAAGYYHSLALREDGGVVAWGAGTNSVGFPHYGQSEVPSDATNIVAIAAGGYHSLALRADGKLLGWGLNNEGQLDFPESATNVIAIAAGHGHNLVLRSNGTLVAWGNNLYGSTNVPPAATNIIAIAAAGWHCLALRDDGALFSWGLNDNGQTLIPTTLTNVQALAAGRYHSLALKSDGTVVGWGLNTSGQSTPPGSPPGGAVALAAGGYHSLALQPDGSVIGWGGRYYDYDPASISSSATNVVAIAAGGGVRYDIEGNPIYFGHSLALRADGKVVGWGDDFYGQRDISAAENHDLVAIAAGFGHSLALRADGTAIGWGWDGHDQRTIPPAENHDLVAIAAGFGHSLALRADGTVVGWGYNYSGQRTIPPAENHNLVAIAAGGGHSLALRADGTVIGWGGNSYGQTGIPTAENHNLVAVAAGWVHSMALRDDGTVIGWGDNTYGQRDIPPAENHDLMAIGAARDHSMAMRADGTIICWGSNGSRQLNVPASLTRYESRDEFAKPAEAIPTDVKKVAAGADYTLALRAGGQVLAWGVNDAEQCSVPAGLGPVRDIAAGQHHSVALTSNGTVVAWGWNAYGQTNVPSSALGNVEAVAAGGNHSLALKSDGTVLAWGCNNAGQTNVPADLENVVAIAAGVQHSLALKADSTVVAWGATNAGGVPFGLSNVVAIAAGEWHDLALRDTGEVVAWGGDAFGQTDVPLDAQSGVVAIKASNNHSLALKADGTVVAWGENTFGQTNLPPGLSNVVAMAAGWRHNVFLTAESQPAGSGGELEFFPANVPSLITKKWLREVNANSLAELDLAGTLNTKAIELSGAKALFQAVLELGMPYTLERDDVLHGFLYGTEALPDWEVAQDLFSAETNNLATTPHVRPMVLEEVVSPRLTAFETRLDERLLDLQATGQPEIPRMVGHTLRLLNLLRDAWASAPPPTLEMWSENNSPRLLLYGEPYARYTLQYSDSLSVPGWTSTTITNLHSEQVIAPPVSGSSQRFYQIMLPVP